MFIGEMNGSICSKPMGRGETKARLGVEVERRGMLDGIDHARIVGVRNFP